MTFDDFEALAKSENNLHFIGDYTELESTGLGTITAAYFSARRARENIYYIVSYMFFLVFFLTSYSYQSSPDHRQNFSNVEIV